MYHRSRATWADMNVSDCGLLLVPFDANSVFVFNPGCFVDRECLKASELSLCTIAVRCTEPLVPHLLVCHLLSLCWTPRRPDMSCIRSGIPTYVVRYFCSTLTHRVGIVGLSRCGRRTNACLTASGQQSNTARTQNLYANSLCRVAESPLVFRFAISWICTRC